MKFRAQNCAKPIICWLLVAIWFVVIFSLSASNSNESSKQSEGFLRGFMSIFGDNVSENLIHSLKSLVRKAAHFAEYFILGGLLSVAVGCHQKRAWPRFFISFAAGSAYAVTDEIHQIFVPGRAGMIEDVLLDSVGVAAGAAFIALCVALIARGLKRKIKPAEDLNI